MCELKEKFPELTNGDFRLLISEFGNCFGLEEKYFKKVLFYLDEYFEDDSNFWLTLEAMRRQGILDSSNT